ncbi:RHS repeat protein [[Empedobacter] haloabium]|uniref:RHS repeat protein n=1 Tax=[Empedobacter] haloabium TaxID=592317 RepID=A0ABZ1UL98_9BURK
MSTFADTKGLLNSELRMTIAAMRTALAAALIVLAPLNAWSQAQNSTSYFEYDAQGNRKKFTDPLNSVTDYHVDALNRLKQTIGPVPVAGEARPIITTDHDALDYPSFVEDPRSKRTLYSVDGFGNQTVVTSPDTAKTTRIPDLSQNLTVSETDARGQTATYAYDDIGRPKSVTFTTGAPIVFEYDGGPGGPVNAKGQLSKMTDESGITTYGYNDFGELESKTQTVTVAGKSLSHTVKYRYGEIGPANGHLSQTIYPSGTRLVIGFDSAGRPQNLSINPMNGSGTGTDTSKVVNVVLYTAYNASSHVAGWTWGNSTSTVPNGYSRSFDLDGRIDGYTLGNANIAGAWRQIGYDAAGRIKTYRHATNNTVVKAAALDQAFDYDALGRLTWFTSATSTQTYKYDPNGNRIRLTIGSSTYTNTIDPASNRLMGTTGPAPARTMRYDEAGNLLSDGVTSYTYSPRGRMATSTVGNTVTSYRYNGLGQRVWQKSSSETVNPAGIYVYDEAGNLLGEYDTATGKPAREIIYHQGIPVAVLSYRATGTAPNQVWSTEVGYIFTDHLNTPRVIARASDNKVVWRWDDADPFGVAPPNENPSGLGTFTFNMRMPGQYYDRATNLFYNYFRDYEPQTAVYPKRSDWTCWWH